MVLIVAFFLLFIGIPLFLLFVFMTSDISRYSWGYRIRRIVYMDGTSKYYIQQRVPLFVFPVWLNCSYMIGMDTYQDRWYDTEREAQEFLEKFIKFREEEKKYRIRSKETIKTKKKWQ